MWRLWNKLFGWHYVIILAGRLIKLRRVIIGGDGNIYVTYAHNIWALDEDGMMRAPDMRTRFYIPLTFKPEELIK